MNTVFRLLAVVSVVLLGAAGQEAQARTIRLFVIGNSFSGNATRFLPQIARSAGHEVVIGRAEGGGWSLQQHWEAAEAAAANPTDPKGKPYQGKSLRALLSSGVWDIVTIQQYSYLSGDAATYRPYARKLREYVKTLQPKAEVVVHQTWAYRSDAGSFGQIGPNRKAKSQREMWEMSRAAYHAVAAELGARLLPVGDAFWRVNSVPRWGYRKDLRLDFVQDAPVAKPVSPGLPDQTNSLHVGYRRDSAGKLVLDANHANDAGCYLAGLIWYGALFGESPEKPTFAPAGVPADFAAYLRRTAAQVLNESVARFGVNLSGAEFGSSLPGTFGTHYTYPTPAVLDYYRAKNRTLIRLPFKWERMQHALNAPLDQGELARLRGVLRAAGERGMHIILDVHNYGRYKFTGEEKGESHVIGSERVPVAAFADFWSRLAAAVKDEPGVWAYALMNEPHDMGDPERWPRAAQAAVDAIRRIDGKTTIIVPGDSWSSARRWRSVGEALNEKVRDPQNNLIFEAHCYFDKDQSGTYAKSYDEEGGSPDTGVDNVRPFVEWCREKGVRGLVGEFGVPDTDPRWLVTMDRFLAYLQANGISATYWAGGPWWGKYPLSIEPADARAATPAPPIDRPQMLVLRKYPG